MPAAAPALRARPSGSMDAMRVYRAEALERERAIRALASALENEPDVEFAWLHGSFLTGGGFRDVDVGVHLTPAAGGRPRQGVELAVRLGHAVHLPVDVRVLNDAPVAFLYTYDFGDDWLHTVTLELVNDADAEVAYPRLLDAEGRCPPEDCGGAGGYARYLEAISDPRHEDHEEMVEWRGPGFDPKVVDEDAIRRALAALGAPRRRTAGRKKVAGGRKTAGTRKRES